MTSDGTCTHCWRPRPVDDGACPACGAALIAADALTLADARFTDLDLTGATLRHVVDVDAVTDPLPQIRSQGPEAGAGEPSAGHGRRWPWRTDPSQWR